jgi:hypothetical protein
MFTKQIHAGQYLTEKTFHDYPEAWNALIQVINDNRYNTEDIITYDEKRGHINIELERFFCG